MANMLFNISLFHYLIFALLLFTIGFVGVIVSKNIFKILRKVDSYNPDIVLIEGVQKDGLGLAIMNRLIRACEHNYIEL